MASSGSQHRVPYVVAPPPDAGQLPSLSQMPSQVPSQMWTEDISSWSHNGQIVTASASGQMATSGQPRLWEGHFHPTQGQGHESQEENVYSDQTQTYPVNVPPPGSGATGTQGFLRPVSLIPEQYRSLFSQFPYFNIVQSTVFDDVFYTDRSLVVSAPTGSGKTVVMELALVRLLMAKATEADAEDAPMPPRVVYMAPMKALVTERYIDWQMRLRELGVICAEITGDTDHDDIAVIAKSQVILTTPEKWDSLTRRWRNHVTLMEAVSLLLIDEVHVLGDQTRGPTMEAVVSRMKTIRTTRPSTSPHRLPLRFVAVSATIPNAEDLAVWLSDGQSPAVTHKLEESLRPVKLRRVVLGYDCPESWSEFRFDLSLTYSLATVIATYSENKPTLVFASTRKGAQMAASTLSKEARLVRNSSHKQLLTSVGNLLRDNKLRECLLAGVAYHHAGLDMADRRQVEELFTSGHLPVLVSTSTLAMGVNLPAHLVVVKSTSQYNGSAGGHEEYSTGQILQMIGRAGRPQFDRQATAVIMTKRQLKAKYENLVNGKDVLESHLHQHLIEHLNAEIVLGTVTDLGVAVEWLRTTFLYVRVQRNPRHYGLQAGLQPNQLEAKLQELCTREVNALSRAGMISQSEVELQPLTPGRLMARYCVSFATMENFTQLRGDESLKELVEVISSTREFWDVKLRTSEKRVLNSINKTQGIGLRFPIKGRIMKREQKINCLIQAMLGSQTIPEPSLTQDANKIFRTGQRSTKCLAEYGATRSEYELQLNTALLAKCFRCRLWENSRHVTRQLENIGPSFSAAFVHAKITSFSALETLSPRDVELILNRQPPFGNKIRDQAVKLPRYELTLQQTNEVAPRTSEVRVTVDLVNKDDLVSGATTPRHHSCRLVIGDLGNCVVFHQRITDAALLVSGSISRTFTVSRSHAGDELAVNFISETWAGLDVQSCYTPRYLGPPPTPPPPLPSASTPALEDAQTHHGAGSQGKGAGGQAGRRACLHACGDKTACAHSCCKVGVSGRGRSNNSSNGSSNDSSSSTATNSRNSSGGSRQKQNLPGLVQEMRARAGQLPFTPGKKIKMAEGEGRTDGHESNLSRFRYTPNRPRLLPFPVPKGGSRNASVLPGSTCKPSDQDIRNFSLAKNQPNLHHFFQKNQNGGGGGGGRDESATLDARDHAPEGFSSVEEREAYEDLVNTFGYENKENFPGDFDDDDFLSAEASVGEPRGECDEYDEAFNEPLGIEDDLCDRSPSANLPGNIAHARSRSASQSPQGQNGGGAKAGRNSSDSPALADQHQAWNSGMSAGFKVPVGAQGHRFPRPGSQGSASQSLPVGPQINQGSQFQRALNGQGNQYQRPPSTQGNRFQRPPSAQGNQVQRPPVAQHNQFQRPPHTVGNQFHRPPHNEGSQFQRPPHTAGNQFHRPPHNEGSQFQRPPHTVGNQFQRPPHTVGNQFQRPPYTVGNQFQRPPLNEGNQFQRPPNEQSNQIHELPGNHFQQSQCSQNQFQRPPNTQVSQIKKSSSPQGYQLQPTQGNTRLQRPSSQFLRGPTCQFQSPPGTQGRPPNAQGSQLQRPPFLQNNNFQRPPRAQVTQFQGPPNAQNNQLQRPPCTQGTQFQGYQGTQNTQYQRPVESHGSYIHEPSTTQGQFQIIPGAQDDNKHQFQRQSAGQGSWQNQKVPGVQGTTFQMPTSEPPAMGSQFEGIQSSHNYPFQGGDGDRVNNLMPNEQTSHQQMENDVQMPSSGNQFHAEHIDSVHRNLSYLMSMANNMNQESACMGNQGEFRGSASYVGAGDAVQDPSYCLEYATGCNSFSGEFYAPPGVIASGPSAMPFERPETFPSGAGLAPLHGARSQTWPAKNPASREWRSSSLGQQARAVGGSFSRSDAPRPNKPVAGVRPFVSMTTTAAAARKEKDDLFSHLTKEWAERRHRIGGGGGGGGGREGKIEDNRGKHTLLTGSGGAPPSAPQKSHEDWRDLEVFQWCRQQERLSLDSLYKGSDAQDAAKEAPSRTSEYQPAANTSFPTGLPPSEALADYPGAEGGLGCPGNAGTTNLNVTTTQKVVEGGAGGGRVGVTLTNVGGVQQNININLSNFVDSGVSSQTGKGVSGAQKQVRADPLVRGILKNTSHSTWSGPPDIFQGIL